MFIRYKNINIMNKYICTVCYTIYYPEKGEPEDGIAPGTAFEDLPANWTCSVCGTPKDKFELLSEERYKKLTGGGN